MSLEFDLFPPGHSRPSGEKTDGQAPDSLLDLHASKVASKAARIVDETAHFDNVPVTALLQQEGLYSQVYGLRDSVHHAAVENSLGQLEARVMAQSTF